MRSVWGLRVRFVVIGVVLSKMVSCSDGGDGDGSNETAAVRLAPVSVESADSPGDAKTWALFDRDTRVGLSPPSTPPGTSTRVSVALGRTTRITQLKIFGASPHMLDVRTGDGTAIPGLEHVRLGTLGAGWNALRLPDSTSADEIVLELELALELELELARAGGGDVSVPAPIGEIELWGMDRPTPALDAKAVGALATGSLSPAMAPPGLDVVAATDPGPIDL